MVTTHQLTNQRVKAIRKVVLEDSNTMKDILDPSSVGFRPHQVLLLSISYATKDVLGKNCAYVGAKYSSQYLHLNKMCETTRNLLEILDQPVFESLL